MADTPPLEVAEVFMAAALKAATAWTDDWSVGQFEDLPFEQGLAVAQTMATISMR